MTLSELLQHSSLRIIAKASNALARAHLKSYERAGTEMTRLRLQALFNRLTRCVEDRKAWPMIRYVEDIAQSRFYDGVVLSEVQTAFNALEEAIWVEMRGTMAPTEFIEAVGLLSAILGLGKDALARTYVSLASTRHAPALNTDLLAQGF